MYLSTLTEVDYETSLNSIENNYNLNPESSWQDRARVKNLRKLESYNYELEVIAKNELNEVIGHVVLAEVKLSSKNKKAIALAIGALSVDKSIRNQGLGQALLKAV
ncbi:GNAT family N-acetyltransferase, partial [Staphylococcus argensis]|uniref:GNAT family N-acetyltransferase n=1 Tax=Staphylococcus argensis TaxID=1607738 RepID=UPI0021BDC065